MNLLIIFYFIFNWTFNFGQGQVRFPDDNSLMHILGGPKVITTRVRFPDSQNTCTTPQQETGKCVSLRDCPELENFVRSNGLRSQSNVNFLRSRICSFEANSVKLCCLSEDTTNPPTTPTRSGGGRAVLPTKDECGFATIRSRITEGKEYSHGSHPWLVSLGYPLNNGSFNSICGGTLISKRHVLTAAHCYISQPGRRPITHARVGEHSLSENTERPTPVTLSVIDTKSPGYDSVSQENDIELLTLESDVEFNSFVRPACLPFDLEHVDFETKSLIIIGWGDTRFRSFQGNDVPLTANVTGVSKAVCKEVFSFEPRIPLDNTQFCAGEGPEDACQGDSGGPLLYNDLNENFRVFLLGIISFGVQCGNPNFPGVYTFIPEFLPWIVENL